MSAVAFNSLAYAKKLQQAGFSETQAEVLAEENVRTLETNLATKRDLEKFKNYTKEEFRDVRHAIEKVDINIDVKAAELKADLLKWIISLLFLQGTAIVTLIKLL